MPQIAERASTVHFTAAEAKVLIGQTVVITRANGFGLPHGTRGQVVRANSYRNRPQEWDVIVQWPEKVTLSFLGRTTTKNLEDLVSKDEFHRHFAVVQAAEAAYAGAD